MAKTSDGCLFFGGWAISRGVMVVVAATFVWFYACSDMLHLISAAHLVGFHDFALCCAICEWQRQPEGLCCIPCCDMKKTCFLRLKYFFI